MAFHPMKNQSRVKTPTLLQMEATECGAAALGIVLHYYGLFLPVEELRITCGVSRDGSKAGNIIRAAKSYGLDAKGVKWQPEQLFEQRKPVIVFWEFNHFVVLEGRKGNRVYLNDPATGPRQVTLEEFDKSFTGVALIMEPGERFEKKGAPSSLIGGLRKRLSGSGGPLSYIVLVTLALVIPGLVIPGLTKLFIDDILIERMATWVGPLLGAMGIAFLANVTLTWLQQRHLLRLETKLSTVLSARFLWHVLRLPIEFFNQRYTGDIVARIRSNDTIAWLISGGLGTGAVNVLMIGFYAAVMALYDWALTAIALAFAIVNVAAMRLVSRSRQDRSVALEQEQGKLLATGFSGIYSIETLKATGAEDDFFIRWSGYQARVLNSQQTLGLYDQVIAVLPALLAGLGLALVLGAGGYRIVHGDMTLGTLVAFQLLLVQFNTPIRQLVQAGGDLQVIRGDLARLDDVFRYDLDPRWRHPLSQAADLPAKLTGHLELKNVSFGYSPLDPPIIEDFNLTLDPGSRVALVGATGSGKSTIARLILGLYRPWTGEVLYDGTPIDDVPTPILVSSVSSVDQSIFLFSGTLEDNLTLWDTTITVEEMTRAAKDAAVYDVIAGRKGGFASAVEEGGRNFSGGQGQRMEIARALVKAPSVLVLDEATSALDPGTEQEIDRNLRHRGCTCIIIAHRLSTIRDCDEIIVLDRGRIVERGTHDQLISSGGTYAGLIAAE